MRLSRLVPIFIILVPLILLTLLNGGTSLATEFRPGPPDKQDTAPQLQDYFQDSIPGETATGLGNHPDIHSFVDIPAPSANFNAAGGGNGVVASSDLAVSPASGMQLGAVVATVDTPAVLGLSNTACATTVPTFFTMMNAETSSAAVPYTPAVTLTANISPTDTTVGYTPADIAKDPIGVGDEIQIDSEKMRVVTRNTTANTLTVERAFNFTAAAAHTATTAILRGRITPGGPATDLLRNLAEDNDGDGIPNHVEQLPSYTETLLDPDGPGVGLPPLALRARYSGFDSVADVTVILQLVFLEPGDLRKLPNGGAHTANLGVAFLTILQDPTLPPSNSAITDFCTPLLSTVVFFGRAHDNACTPRITFPVGDPCKPLLLGGAQQLKGADGFCPGTTTPNESGSTIAGNPALCSPRTTNPSEARTVTSYAQYLSQRDFDGDGIENGLDPCTRTWSDPDGNPATAGTIWDPRATAPQLAIDADSDRLDKSCDANDTAGQGGDQDGDAWKNALDNCPTEPRNGGAVNFNNTQTIRERYRDSNGDNTYDAGEDIIKDNGDLIFNAANDLKVYDGTALPNAVEGDTLKPFYSVEQPNGTPNPLSTGYERHVDSDKTAGKQAGRYKEFDDDNGAITDLREAIVLDVNDNRRFDLGTDQVLADDPSSPDPVDGDLLIGFLPEARHISVFLTSGIQTTDNITIGPRSTLGGTKTDFDRNNITVARPGAFGIVSWEGSTQPTLANEPSAVAGGGNDRDENTPVTIKFTTNVNRGQADFDVVYPLQVPDGGSRSDQMGPPSLADTGCDRDTALGSCVDGVPAVCTDGPNTADGHYHRTATITRVCVSNNQAVDDTDGDGACKGTAFAGDVEDPCDGDGEPACAALSGICPDAGSCDSDADGVRDRNDNCISVSNPRPAGFSQPDKDQDGVGDACDTFNDSDGDGFSDRMESDAEEGTWCDNAIDDDGDGAVNDGCPRAGPAETDCAATETLPLDDDGDGYTNDGCPPVIASSAGTLPNVGCPRGAGPNAANSHPKDFNGDNRIDITDMGEVAGSFNQSTPSHPTDPGTASERKDIAGGDPNGNGDSRVDITDMGEVAGSFNTDAC